MSTWALIVVMRFGLAAASYNNLVVDGFGSKPKCEEAAALIGQDGGYVRHICIEVKQ